MQDSRNEKPTAGAVGLVEDREEPATQESYSDFPPRQGPPAELELDWARENDPLHLSWAKAKETMQAFAAVDDEHGALARRALEIWTGPPIPDALWNVAWAHSLTVCGLIYGRNPVDRTRRAQLLGDLFEEAEIVKAEIGSAA